MKKVIFVFVVWVAAALPVSAQFFVGGGFGVDFSSRKSSSGNVSVKTPSTFTFQFSPKIGHYLNDDFAIGLDVSFVQMNRTSIINLALNEERKITTTAWGIGSFARYNFIEAEKFSLLLEGAMGIVGIKSKTKTGNTTREDDPFFGFTFGVFPVLSFNLTDNLNIEASSNFLRFGFQTLTQKDSNDSSSKVTQSGFGFGVNSSVRNIEDMTIQNPVWRVGLVFKF